MTDSEILALRQQQLRDDIARKNARQSGSLETAVAQAQAEIRQRAPGFDTLTPNMKRITALRRAITGLGVTPVGSAFPEPRDEAATIAALEEQLLNLQLRTAPSPTFTQTASYLNERARATGGIPSNAATETFGAGYVPPAAGTSIPADARPAGSGAYTKADEVTRRVGYAVNDGRKELEESATPLDQFTERQQRIMALYDAIRARGEAPDVPRTVATGEETTAILRLTRQLRSIIEDELTPTTSDAVGVTDRASGLTPEQAARTEAPGRAPFNPDDILGRDDLPPELKRMFRNQDPSPDRNRTDFQSGIVPDPGPKEKPRVIRIYDELRPLFKDGELEGFLFDFLARKPEIIDQESPELIIQFLQDLAVGIGAHALSTRPYVLTDLPPQSVMDANQISDLMRAIKGYAETTSGKVDFNGRDINWLGPVGLLTDQLIPDSVAENLPGPLRIVVQSALDLTAPLNAIMFATGVGAAGSFARALLGELVGNVASQLAEEAGAPPIVQALAGVLSGNLGKNAPDLAEDFSVIGQRLGKGSASEVKEFREALSTGGMRGALNKLRESLPADAVEMKRLVDDALLSLGRHAGLMDLPKLRSEVGKNALITTIAEASEASRRRDRSSASTARPFPFGDLMAIDTVNSVVDGIFMNEMVDDEERQEAILAVSKIINGVAPELPEMNALLESVEDTDGRLHEALVKAMHTGALLPPERVDPFGDKTIEELIEEQRRQLLENARPVPTLRPAADPNQVMLLPAQ